MKGRTSLARILSFYLLDLEKGNTLMMGIYLDIFISYEYRSVLSSS